jgi:hypothetical protein
LVQPEIYQQLLEALLNVAGVRKEEKLESIEGHIIQNLHELADENANEIEIENKEVLEKLNKDRPQEKKLTSQYLGRKLKALGLRKRRTMDGAVVMLSHHELYLLCSQYGIETCAHNISSPPMEGNVINVSNVITDENTAGCRHDVSSTTHHNVMETSCKKEKENQLAIPLHDNNDDYDVSLQGGKEKITTDVDNANYLHGEI